jgi:hypothetical protein
MSQRKTHSIILRMFVATKMDTNPSTTAPHSQIERGILQGRVVRKYVHLDRDQGSAPIDHMAQRKMNIERVLCFWVMGSLLVSYFLCDNNHRE